MARTRNIKAGFATNELLAELGESAHLFFATLWPHADREGRLEDRPKRLKVLCMPFYDHDIDALLDALASGPEPFIARYEVDGKKYIQILNWHKHQSPYTREPESVIPPYKPKHRRSTTNAVRASCASTDARNQMGVETVTESEGESKGETNATPFDAFWSAAPRKVGKAAARSAYTAAVKALRAAGKAEPDEFLLERITAFAQTPKAKGDFCPHPATWLNQGRYDDDPATWQDAGNSGGNRNGRQLSAGPGQQYAEGSTATPPGKW